MGLRVLIVEDDQSFRKVLEIRLRSWRRDLVFTFAPSIADARKALADAADKFGLVLLDHHLPDGKGLELTSDPRLAEATVLAVSSDDAPDLPGSTVKAGAQHFLYKRQVTEPLFIPLLEALLERKRLEQEALAARLRESQLETIRTLLATLRHEINNPLGAVLGGAYILRAAGELGEEQAQALRLIEASGNRIKHVLTQLCDAAELETVRKAREQMFQVPGDKPWENNK